jgi:hypothetical protein
VYAPPASPLMELVRFWQRDSARRAGRGAKGLYREEGESWDEMTTTGG